MTGMQRITRCPTPAITTLRGTVPNCPAEARRLRPGAYLVHRSSENSS